MVNLEEVFKECFALLLKHKLSVAEADAVLKALSQKLGTVKLSE